jgi:cell division protein ZapA (FtsZ GTPase activity inhibitor)
MNIFSSWKYLTTDQGVLSSHGFEIIGALMIIRCIDWLPKKIKKCKADIRQESSRPSSQEDANGQAG